MFDVLKHPSTPGASTPGTSTPDAGLSVSAADAWAARLMYCIWIVWVALLLFLSSTVQADTVQADTVRAEPADEAVEGLPDLPEAVASFGAAVSGDDLVVFGGHIGRTHQHSIENLSHRFVSLDLQAPEKGWRDLGEVDGLQGVPLVAYGREVCRIGGLEARNHVGEEEELFSRGDARCFHLDKKRWRDLPDLPAPRSSHDAVVHEGKVYVVGGWQLRGSEGEPIWQDTMAVLDLADGAAWQEVDAPFRRRALAVAAAGDHVVAFGGLGDETGTSREVDVYDVRSGQWSKGEALPSVKGLKGFGVSAFGVGERIYLSGGDGVVHGFDPGSGWEQNLGKLETARFFHRLLPHGDRLLFLGGAGRGGHRAGIETLQLAALRPGGAESPTSDVSEPTSVAPADPAEVGTWPGFRGAGAAPGSGDLPERWSDTQNVAWRLSLPGYGQSAPVFWQGQAFVTSVEGESKETLILSAFDTETGEVRWRRRFAASQEIPSSRMVTRGAPTPVVDGERIYAFWESGDLVTLSHEGETLWQRSLTRDYGEAKGNHGLGSSPVLTRDAVVLQVTHEGPSYFIALDKGTGKTRWKVDRPSKVAWTTPVVVTGTYGEEIVSSAAGRVEGLDARTGERLWIREGVEKNHVPSVVVDRGLVIVPASEAGHNFALDRLGRGELGDEHVVWTAEGVTSGFGSPVVAGGCVLFVNKAGVVTCVDREAGQVLWKERLDDACWTTPVVLGDRVFFFTKKGSTAVLDLSGDEPRWTAENALSIGDGTVYGAAVAGDAFLLRTGTELIKIATDPPSSPSSASIAP